MQTVMIDGRGVRHYIENGRALCGKIADHLAECNPERYGRLCEACAAVIDDGGNAADYDYGRVPRRNGNGRVWVGGTVAKPKVRLASNDPTQNFRTVYAREARDLMPHLEDPERGHRYTFCNRPVADETSARLGIYCDICLAKAAAYWHTLTPFDEIEAGSIVRWNGRVKGFVSHRDGEVFVTTDAGVEMRIASPLAERAVVLLGPDVVDAIALRALADAPQMVNRLLVEMGHSAAVPVEAE